MQILINILISFSIVLLISLGFSIVYSTTKFFNLAYAVIITLGAYFTYWFSRQSILPISISIIFALCCALFMGIAIELLIFKPLRKYNNNPLSLLIASLGLYVVIQNIIVLVWGDDTKSIRESHIKVGSELFGAYITDTQIIIIGISLLLFISVILFLSFNRVGRKIRAISSNENLAIIFGIDSNNVVLMSYIIGSFLAAVAGIMVAFDTDMTPTMGFNLLLYGIVAMIIGGIGSNWGLIGGAFLLVTAQNLGAYYIDSKWMDAIAYIILILFLIWRPLGFSGKRLKKVEI